MKKVLFAFLLILSSLNCIAQDKIVLRDSTVLNVKIVENNEKSIIFTYPNEEVKNEKSKSLIAYIIYSSGRREECGSTLKIPTVTSEKEWEKVVVTSNREDVVGLTKIKSVSVSAGNGGVFDSASKAHDKALSKLKKKVAKLQCGIVLIVSENFGGHYNNISSINGEAYK